MFAAMSFGAMMSFTFRMALRTPCVRPRYLAHVLLSAVAHFVGFVDACGCPAGHCACECSQRRGDIDLNRGVSAGVEYLACVDADHVGWLGLRGHLER